jgi:hypothetical protein
MSQAGDGDADRRSDGHSGGWMEDEPLDTGRLALDEEERLPWLESEDDFDSDEATAPARLLGLVLAGILVLAAAVGGIWWLTHSSADSGPVADGGVIKAPARPYKEAPRQPGGKTFAGTGDTSFAVSEGQTRQVRLGQSGSGSKLVAPTPTAAKAPGTASPIAAPPPQEAAGIGVQVGAYSTQASAEAAWGRLTQQYEALSGFHHRVLEGRADIGTVYRLQAVVGNKAAANDLCARLKSAGLACQVKN